MKGVLLSRCDARVVDLSHDVPPFDVWAAAFFLRAVVPYWPAGTIFVAVVDSGARTSPRILPPEGDRPTHLRPGNGPPSPVSAPPAASAANTAVFPRRGNHNAL